MQPRLDSVTLSTELIVINTDMYDYTVRRRPVGEGTISLRVNEQLPIPGALASPVLISSSKPAVGLLQLPEGLHAAKRYNRSPSPQRSLGSTQSICLGRCSGTFLVRRVPLRPPSIYVESVSIHIYTTARSSVVLIEKTVHGRPQPTAKIFARARFNGRNMC